MTQDKTDFSTLIEAVSERQKHVKAYLMSRVPQFLHPHLQAAVTSYIEAGGKSLRPGVLMFSCGAVGGDEMLAIPAAAAVELYHTWTLVHDDIIDRDERRRGSPTVHAQFRDLARTELGYEDHKATHYGLSVAILAGDMQQGWCNTMLTNLYRENHLPPELVLQLSHELFSRVQTTLVDGEALDILYAEMPVEKLNAEQILDMLWKKTGVLYEFAGRAGAAIGSAPSEVVERIAHFTGKCGTAFQIQDDILGIVGNEKQLGKPIGSDVREGKRTLIVLGSLPQMSAAERELTLKTLGNHEASEATIQEVIDLFRKTGGIDYAKTIAQTYVRDALAGIADLPDSSSKRLLVSWANYLIEREF